jgi:hypothetical protein
MRHQLERQLENTSLDRPADERPAAKKMEPESAQDEAVERPLPVTLISRGRTLIIDTNAERAGTLGKILSARQLTCTLMITKSPSTGASFPGPALPGCCALEGLSISGAFGGFLATVTEGEAEKPIEAMDDRRAVFDLVLDL